MPNDRLSLSYQLISKFDRSMYKLENEKGEGEGEDHLSATQIRLAPQS